LQRLIESRFAPATTSTSTSTWPKLQTIPPERLGRRRVRARQAVLLRGKDDDAIAGFATIQTNNPYYFQARYFMATIMVKKKGDLAGASVTYDSLPKLQAPDDSAKENQDLCRWRWAASFYERSQFDKAIRRLPVDPAPVQVLPRRARRAGLDVHQGQGVAEGLAVHRPPPAQQPRPARRARQAPAAGQPAGCASATTTSRTRRSPRCATSSIRSKRQLQAVLVRSQADPAYFDNLVGRAREVRHLGLRAAGGRQSGSSPADVERMINSRPTSVSCQRDLQESEKLIARIQRAMQSSKPTGIFPDLARAHEVARDREPAGRDPAEVVGQV